MESFKVTCGEEGPVALDSEVGGWEVMLNILLDAYAVSPNWGSEPGMGWNWISSLARYCNLIIITEGEWQKEIEIALLAAKSGNMDKQLNPTGLTAAQAEHMHFHYLNVSSEVRSLCWNQGSWSFYLHYANWERRVLELAREIISEEHIDIVHKLNMIGYREPGLLWKIRSIPFVWGPVGGYAGIPSAFLKGSDTRIKSKEMLKNLVNVLMFRMHPRVRKAALEADAVIAAYSETYDALKRVYRPDVRLINETGSFVNDLAVAHNSDADSLNILWVGKFDFRKQLGIALRTMELLREKKNIHLWIAGSGREEENKQYRQFVDDRNLSGTIHFMGVVPNVEIRERMKEMDLLLFTSVHDATSTVVPEAVSAALPVLCHDMRGFGGIVNERIGYKIPAHCPEESARRFAAIIESLDADREQIRNMSEACLERQKEISWDANARKMVAVYEKVYADSVQI